MKFGVFNLGMWHESQTQAEVMRNCLEQAILADESGFDSFWIGEHHFSRHGMIADPLVMAAAVAVRTTRVRIGTAVVVLPLANPVRVAEQAAMVDILSDGRFDLGVGVGYQRREFQGLGLDIETARDRFEEGLAVLLKCFRDDRLAHLGQFTSIPEEADIEVMPAPVQQPHPPLYRAVSTTPASVEAAASVGMSIMVGGPTDTLGVAPEVMALWRSKMIEYGHDPAGRDTPILRGLYVADTDEQAHADLAAIDTTWDAKILQAMGSPANDVGELPKGFEHWKDRFAQRQKATDPDRAGSPPLIGSPDTVRERIGMLRDFGINHVFGQFGFPGMEERQIRRSIELFAKEVIPAFRD